jgi:hypothetical protein
MRNLRNSWILLPVVLLVLPGIGSAGSRLPAFPGAEGFGGYARGGRGGRVLFVTTLRDYELGKEERIPGSLRAACSAKGPRTVIFRVSGTIPLKAPLTIREPYLTLAGQTAPGDGICIKNHGVFIKGTHDIVIRYVRFRPGDTVGRRLANQGEKWATDALAGTRCSNVIIDHCSLSWANDEVLSFTYADDITVQWCFITESLNRSTHPKGRHGFGGLVAYINNGEVTQHHNLWAYHVDRCPRVGSGPDPDKPGLLLDFRNNVIVRGGRGYSAAGSDNVRMNYVANYIRNSGAFSATKGVRMHLSGNLHNGKDTGWKMVRGTCRRMPRPFPTVIVETDSAETAFERVLSSAGAILPIRDAVDSRIAENVRKGTGGIIDSQDQVGGWPELKSAPAPRDEDADGMPDGWETTHGLDVGTADNNGDVDSDGYTNLEEFLNGTDPGSKNQ